MCHCSGHFRACYRNRTLEKIEICVFNISMKDINHVQNLEAMGRLLVIAGKGHLWINSKELMSS